MSKIVLITGASAGIGFALAKKLLEGDNKVYVAARSVDKMGATQDCWCSGLGVD